MTDYPEKFKNYFWGENKLFFPNEEFVIKLSYPRVFVRYHIGDSLFSSFEEFWGSIAEIQYLDCEKPSMEEQNIIMTDIWNYICLEENLLENDFSDGIIDEYIEGDL